MGAGRCGGGGGEWGWNKEQGKMEGGGSIAKNIKKLISGRTSIITPTVWVAGRKRWELGKKYIVAEKKSCKSCEIFQATFSSRNNLCLESNCFFFLANDKNPYPLTYFLVLGSIEYCSILFIKRQCQINLIFYFQRSPILIN